MTRATIKARALVLLRRARDQHDWHSEALACDYAIKALVADGVPEKVAQNNVRRAWAENFAITRPI